VPARASSGAPATAAKAASAAVEARAKNPRRLNAIGSNGRSPG
jgi:hypothetical protein